MSTLRSIVAKDTPSSRIKSPREELTSEVRSQARAGTSRSRRESMPILELELSIRAANAHRQSRPP